MKKIISLSLLVGLFLLPIAAVYSVGEAFEITGLKFCLGGDENRNPINVTDKFSAGTQEVYAWFAWKNAPKSQAIIAKWSFESEDVPILDSPVVLTRKSDQGVLTLKMPKDKTFPAGDYRLDLEADGKVIKSATFKVE